MSQAQLRALEGVGDAAVVAEDGVAYLKIDSEVVDRAALDAFSSARR